METDACWKLDLLDALSSELRFSAAQLMYPSPEDVTFIRPTRVETMRAVANIRAWRSYLPDVCVAAMIYDGWQWST
jgi:hypothetical protein